ncbi:hypothetical protein CTEN210_10338 [Chaetoceros tenuissimus]|uniref:Alpha-ketoglutarate-dependent dioxygenase AlkB-like domain-containing protein n=1 Tax=Chaetoceros tenuissimus TaxID=426638 RepID=A0AAD3CX56_9STRA|nr:hypothetical protein CTEN210_10338 [Chaetoceros tenuissimus]
MRCLRLMNFEKRREVGQLKLYFSSRAKCVPSDLIEPITEFASPACSHVDASFAPNENIKLPSKHLDPKDFAFHPYSALVYTDFVSPKQASALENDILKRMRRKRFEKGHWDAVITNYKEIELPIYNSPTDEMAWNNIHESHPVEMTHEKANQEQVNPMFQLSKDSISAIERVRRHIVQSHFFPSKEQQDNEKILKYLNCHAIHLKKDGMLTAHVDSIKFSGDIVAGLSLKSASIMRLRPASASELARRDGEEEHGDTLDQTEAGSKAMIGCGHVDLYLPPYSLYILSGVSRYFYTHEILPSGATFQLQDESNQEDSSIKVEREDRISVIFRDEK